MKVLRKIFKGIGKYLRKRRINIDSKAIDKKGKKKRGKCSSKKE